MPKVVVYCTNTCPFCHRAFYLLTEKNIEFEQIFLEANPQAQKEMITRSKATSVPQIFIEDYHVGGSDELYALEAQGKLDELLGLDI